VTDLLQICAVLSYAIGILLAFSVVHRRAKATGARSLFLGPLTPRARATSLILAVTFGAAFLAGLFLPDPWGGPLPLLFRCGLFPMLAIGLFAYALGSSTMIRRIQRATESRNGDSSAEGDYHESDARFLWLFWAAIAAITVAISLFVK